MSGRGGSVTRRFAEYDPLRVHPKKAEIRESWGNWPYPCNSAELSMEEAMLRELPGLYFVGAPKKSSNRTFLPNMSAKIEPHNLRTSPTETMLNNIFCCSLSEKCKVLIFLQV